MALDCDMIPIDYDIKSSMSFCVPSMFFVLLARAVFVLDHCCASIGRPVHQ